MKKILIAGLLFVAGVVTMQAQELKVMTYNIRFGELATMKEIAAYIQSENPDFVSLQEVDWKTNRSRAPHQNGVAFINELAQLTGMFGVYGKAIDYSGGYYGVAALSKYPILHSERLLLPNPENKEQRVMLVVEAESPTMGQPITFIATHLEVTSEATRELQAEFIKEQAKSLTQPVILAGDFNARHYHDVITKGFAEWGAATNSDFTYPADKPFLKIDYIFFYPSHAFEVTKMVTDKSIQLSDHLPLWSILEKNNNILSIN